jgi:hypothetical protein
LPWITYFSADLSTLALFKAISNASPGTGTKI